MSDRIRDMAESGRPALSGHVAIARVDHWFKNLFMVPGIIAALGIDRPPFSVGLLPRALAGFLSFCLVASSNYVLNEILDAETDRHHPKKRLRPVPMGRVSVPVAYVQWILLMAAGVGLGFLLSPLFAMTGFLLWVMGCIYNVPPLRAKDVPYVDVLCEAVNNPLRLLAGWLVPGTASIAPLSALLAYWMVGAYFMALKRVAELRELGDSEHARAYRRSFAHYSPVGLLATVVFYGSLSMLFFGAFAMRYRFEMILSFPFVALVMAVYFGLAFKEDSPVQRPEGLFRERPLRNALLLCALVMAVLLFVDIPALRGFLSPTAPTGEGGH
jgi:4-hydroxybenzoate polyprenyltransferase